MTLPNANASSSFPERLAALPADIRRLVAALVVFDERKLIPEAVIARLWGKLAGMDGDATTTLLHEIAGVDLVRFPNGTPAKGVQISLELKLAIVTLVDENFLPQMHSVLLDSYRSATDEGWHTVADDGYLYAHLVEHLIDAERFTELHALFADDRWFKVRTARDKGAIDGFVADIMSAWYEVAEPEVGTTETGVASVFHYALLRTGVNSLAAAFSPEEFRRHLQSGRWTPEKAVSLAQYIPAPAQKMAVYAALLGSGSLPEALHIRLQEQALHATQGFERDEERLAGLEKIVPHLTGARAAHMVSSIEGLRDGAPRQRLFAALADFLPEEKRTALFITALETIAKNPVAHRDLLKALLPTLAAEKLPEALKLVRAIEPASAQIDLLAIAAARYPEPERKKLLREALDIALDKPRPTSIEQRLFEPRSSPNPFVARFMPRPDESTSAPSAPPSTEPPSEAPTQNRRRFAVIFRARRREAQNEPAAAEDAGEEKAPPTLRALLKTILARFMPAKPEELPPPKAPPARPDRPPFFSLAARDLDEEKPHFSPRFGTSAEESAAVDSPRSIFNRTESPSGGLSAPPAGGRRLPFGNESKTASSFSAPSSPARGGGGSAGALPSRSSVFNRPSPEAQQKAAELRAELVHEAFQATAQLNDMAEQIRLLTQLVGQAKVENQSKIVRDILSALPHLTDEWERAIALTAVAPYLDAETVKSALELKTGFSTPRVLAMVLQALLPRVGTSRQGELLSEALAAARAITDPADRLEVLSALHPFLPEVEGPRVVEEMVVLVGEIKDDSRRPFLLLRILPLVGAARRQELVIQEIKAALSLSDEQTRNDAVNKLMAELQPAALQLLLQSVSTLADQSLAAELVKFVMPRLPKERLEDGLHAARTIEAGDLRAAALKAVYLRDIRRDDVLSEALIAAQSIEEPALRTVALETLVAHLTGDEQYAALEDALDSARQIDEEHIRASALVSLVPHLAGRPRTDILQETLVAVRVMSDTWAQVTLLRKLALNLADDQQKSAVLQEALELTQTIDDVWVFVDEFKLLIPHLREQHLSEAFNALQDIEDEALRADVLELLIPQLSHIWLRLGLVIAQNFKNPLQQGRVMAVLVPELKGDLFQEGLRLVRAIPRPSPLANALALLLTRLTDARLESALQTRSPFGKRPVPAGEAPAKKENATGVGSNPFARTPARSPFATPSAAPSRPAFPPEKRPALPLSQIYESLLNDTFQLVKQIPDPAARADACLQLLPHLPAAEDEALAAIAAIEKHNTRALRLIKMMPHLSAARQSDALELARRIQDHSFRARALHAVADKGQGTYDLAILREALAAAREITSAGMRAEVLKALAPHLPAAEQEAVWQEAFEAALHMTGWARAAVLAAVAGHLTGDEQMTALREALLTTRQVRDEKAYQEALDLLAKPMTTAMLDEALAAAETLESESRRVLELKAWSSRLNETQLDQALLMVYNFEDKLLRIESFYIVCQTGSLDAEQKAQVIADAVETAQSIENSEGRAFALAKILPILSPAERADALEIALIAARAIAPLPARSMALGMLVPYLSPAAKTQCIQDALAAAQAIKDPLSQIMNLRALLPYLPVEMHLAVWRRVLRIAPAIEDEWRRAEQLRAAASHIERPLLADMLAALRSLTNSAFRVGVIQALVTKLDPFTLAQIWGLVRDIKDRTLWADAVVALAPALTDDMVRQTLAEVRALSNPVIQSKVYLALLPRLTTPRERPTPPPVPLRTRLPQISVSGLLALAPMLDAEMRQEALNAVRSLKKETEWAAVLAALGGGLQPENNTTSLAVTFNEAQAQVYFWAGLLPALTGAQRVRAQQAALTALEQISGVEEMIAALQTLAPVLDVEVVAEKQVLAMLQTRLKGGAQVRAITAVMPLLSDVERATYLGAYWAHLFEAGSTSPAEYSNATLEILLMAAQFGDFDQQENVLAQMRTLRSISPQDKAKILIALAPHLPPEKRFAAFEMVIEFEGAFAAVLETYAPYLTTDQRRRVIARLRRLRSPFVLQKALRVLSPHLDNAQQREALEIARNVEDLSDRLEALMALVSHLERGTRTDIIAEILAQLQDADLALTAPGILAEIAPHLHGEDTAPALELALALPDEADRVMTLAAMLPVLDDEQRAEAIEAALEALPEIAPAGTAAQAIKALAPHLTGAALVQCYECAKDINDGVFRADAFSVFLLLLPERQEETVERIRRALTAFLLGLHQQKRIDVLRWQHVHSIPPVQTIPRPLRFPVITPEVAARLAESILALCEAWHWE